MSLTSDLANEIAKTLEAYSEEVEEQIDFIAEEVTNCLLYTSPSPRD